MSEQVPRISVVIPALNEMKLIEGTLKQFTPELRKLYKLEIIVSDGGSTDGTLEIANKYSDVLVLNQDGSRQNISNGRNSGARSAHGEFLLFINADTLIENPNEFIPVLIKAFELPGVSAITTNVRVFENEERLSDRLFHTTCNWYFWMLNVIGIGMGRGECQAIRRELFSQLGGYDETIAAGEDFEFFVRVRRHGKIAFLRAHTVRESPRRYRKYGYLWVSLLWSANAVTALLFRRSIVKQWKPVR